MCSLFGLSDDIIITHILTRLPVKSLIQFRCVCKSWKYILSNPDPQFITSHITHTSRNPDYECLIMLTFSKKCSWPFYWSVDILSRSRFSYTPMENVPRHYRIVGSINGLVCLMCDYMFLLWNPATGLGKTVPHPPTRYWGNKLVLRHLYGFGWDYVKSEFKVVVCYNDEKSLQALVYTSASDSWNGLVIPDTFSHKDSIENPDIIVEGCPYWTGYNRFVVKFETGSNQFKKFLLPCSCRIQMHCNYLYTLVNVKDCLAVMAYSPAPDTRIDVFHLDEECGVWSKTYTVGPNTCFVGKFSQCFKYGGEIVFDDGNMLYDPKTDGIMVISDGYREFVSGYSYTPSLVFLQGMEPVHTNMYWRSPELLTPTQSHLRLLFTRLLGCLGWN